MDFQSVLAEIEPLTKAPIHLPSEHLRQHVFPAIAATMVITTAIYLMSWPLANRLFDEKARNAKRRLCYQITNISTNMFLGLTGCYFEYRLLPPNASKEMQIQGNEHFFILELDFSCGGIDFHLTPYFVGNGLQLRGHLLQDTVGM